MLQIARAQNNKICCILHKMESNVNREKVNLFVNTDEETMKTLTTNNGIFSYTVPLCIRSIACSL
jgi:hypothetical protein